MLLPTNEPIISPTIILAPVQWDIMTEITEAHVTDPPPQECPSYLTHQLLLSWYCRYNATTHQPLLVVHTAGQHDILHPGLSNVKCHQILSPTTFITNLPLSMGHTTILTVTDRFSKACRPENLIRVISRKLMATTERGDLERGTRTSAMACSQNEGAG